MSGYSFSEAICRKPVFKTRLKDTSGGYVSCEVRLYKWGSGTIIKIEGVNISREGEVYLVLGDMGRYTCNPCKSGYLFSIFFSDIPAYNFLETGAKVFLKNDKEKILAAPDN